MSTVAAQRTITWDEKEFRDKSAAELAKEARDKAGETQDVINTKLEGINTNITNIKNSIPPQIHKVQGKNGATCTTNGYFTVVISASNANQYRAWDSAYSAPGWGSSNVVTIPIGSGARTIIVEAKKENDRVVARSSTTVFGI
jgi:hypothetical protein